MLVGGLKILKKSFALWSHAALYVIKWLFFVVVCFPKPLYLSQFRCCEWSTLCGRATFQVTVKINLLKIRCGDRDSLCGAPPSAALLHSTVQSPGSEQSLVFSDRWVWCAWCCVCVYSRAWAAAPGLSAGRSGVFLVCLVIVGSGFSDGQVCMQCDVVLGGNELLGSVFVSVLAQCLL